eukprot:scaffold10995_cov112-Isochrysis_galbana.AAC.2
MHGCGPQSHAGHAHTNTNAYVGRGGRRQSAPGKPTPFGEMQRFASCYCNKKVSTIATTTERARHKKASRGDIGSQHGECEGRRKKRADLAIHMERTLCVY